MPTVTMPQLGESDEEGTIGKWLKNVGDLVAVDDPLVEVVTDKVNAEVPSPFAGTLTQIIALEGETVGNDAPLAEIVGAAAGDEVSSADDVTPAGAKPPAPVEETPPPVLPPVAVTAEVAAGGPATASSNGASSNGSTATAVATATLAPSSARMTPAVRRLAREHQVDLAAVTGSGIGGRITRNDVQSAVGDGASGTAPAPVIPVTSAAVTAAPSPVAEGDSLKKLSPMRKAIAKQMTRSLEVPTAYIMVEVDMSNVVRRRTKANAEYKSREGMSLSYVAFMTKACVEALRKHPDINAHWTDEGHWRRKAINVGIAVAVEDGLVVPVIKDADNLSLHGLDAAINDLASRSRNKKILPDEMRGGTFTVDNTGWTGSILTLPIINIPEVAIITMEKVVKRPVVIEDPAGDAIAVRQMMNMCIAIDHRATDGAQAGEFLEDVREWLEAVDDNTPIW